MRVPVPAVGWSCACCGPLPASLRLPSLHLPPPARMVYDCVRQRQETESSSCFRPCRDSRRAAFTKANRPARASRLHPCLRNEPPTLLVRKQACANKSQQARPSSLRPAQSAPPFLALPPFPSVAARPAETVCRQGSYPLLTFSPPSLSVSPLSSVPLILCRLQTGNLNLSDLKGNLCALPTCTCCRLQAQAAAGPRHPADPGAGDPCGAGSGQTHAGLAVPVRSAFAAPHGSG